MFEQLTIEFSYKKRRFGRSSAEHLSRAGTPTGNRRRDQSEYLLPCIVPCYYGTDSDSKEDFIPIWVV